jgi:peptidoglycan/xylan/chitin deacetylase (PgdA/CDA1 family)
MISQRLLTISIDDGHPADLRVAEMLARFGLSATFYIPARNPERQVISPAEIRQLAQGFEIGSHTLNHIELTRVPKSVAWNEISGSKHWVEDTISAPATAFCYPRGKHNRAVTEMVRAAGFAGARTVMLNLTGVPKDRYRWGVTTQGYSHTPAVQIRHALAESNFAGLRSYATIFRFASQWDTHLLTAVDCVERGGGVLHLFLHGWEIEERGEWGILEDAFRTLATRTRLTTVTNGDLFLRIDSLNIPQLAPEVNSSVQKPSVG